MSASSTSSACSSSTTSYSTSFSTSLSTTTSTSSDTLRFSLDAYGDSVLGRMNSLRHECLFCDVTLVLGPPGAPLRFQGHRVVLAASSHFLRDKFLLHQGRAELCVGVVPQAEVGRRLLMSCYTGLLEVPLRELVSYLTTASALQMSQVVDRCAQAVSQYLHPSLAHLKTERTSGDEAEAEDLLRQQPPARPHRQEDRGLARREEGGGTERYAGGARVKTEPGTLPGPKVESRQEAREVKEVKPPWGEESERPALQEEEEEDGEEEVQRVHTSSPSYYHGLAPGPHRRKRRPPAPFRDNKPPLPDPCHAPPNAGLADSSQDVGGGGGGGGGGGEGPREEEEMYLPATRFQTGGEEEEDDSPESGPLSRLGDGGLLPGGGSLYPGASGPARPYLCRRCDRVFQHLDGYVGHLKEHRQYLCLLCGKSFSQKSNLTRHVRVHTGVKPFRCPLCHKTFSQKATLQDHLNLHTGDKPHKCNYCAVHFAHKPGLRRHLKDIHGKSSLQNVLEDILD